MSLVGRLEALFPTRWRVESFADDLNMRQGRTPHEGYPPAPRMGDEASSHAPSLASMLPCVWSMVTGGGWGALCMVWFLVRDPEWGGKLPACPCTLVGQDGAPWGSLNAQVGYPKHVGAFSMALWPVRPSLIPCRIMVVRGRVRAGRIMVVRRHAEASSVTLSARKDVVLDEAFRGVAATRRGASPIILECFVAEVKARSCNTHPAQQCPSCRPVPRKMSRYVHAVLSDALMGVPEWPATESQQGAFAQCWHVWFVVCPSWTTCAGCLSEPFSTWRLKSLSSALPTCPCTLVGLDGVPSGSPPMPQQATPIMLVRFSRALSRCLLGRSVQCWVVRLSGGRVEASSVTLSSRKDVVLDEAFRGIVVARRGASPITRKKVLSLEKLWSVEVLVWSHGVEMLLAASHGCSEASSETRPARKDVMLGESLRGTTATRRRESPIIRKCVCGWFSWLRSRGMSLLVGSALWENLAVGKIVNVGPYRFWRLPFLFALDVEDMAEPFVFICLIAIGIAGSGSYAHNPSHVHPVSFRPVAFNYGSCVAFPLSVFPWMRCMRRMGADESAPLRPFHLWVPLNNTLSWCRSCLVVRGGNTCTSSKGVDGCYLVDPTSSHMLVSKIKPCMCKYELIQTVKL
ncbi:unnamed protein product [Lupinus luteus]|uniref:Uncharacterized protein n=1 Tax=Lupinus luteus TaxID=3873 RepID=A0AAV1VZ36_LUPLU